MNPHQTREDKQAKDTHEYWVGWLECRTKVKKIFNQLYFSEKQLKNNVKTEFSEKFLKEIDKL